LICNQGYSSSLAAARLLDLDAADVTDVIGGFEAWQAAGLPVERVPAAALG
jgi:rhodanese-related sulfurtransferase